MHLNAENKAIKDMLSDPTKPQEIIALIESLNTLRPVLKVMQQIKKQPKTTRWGNTFEFTMTHPFLTYGEVQIIKQIYAALQEYNDLL